MDIRDCVAMLGLEDVASTGCFFTWNNNFVKSKLDQEMINNAWRDNG